MDMTNFEREFARVVLGVLVQLGALAGNGFCPSWLRFSPIRASAIASSP